MSGARGPESLQGIIGAKNFGAETPPESPIEPASLLKSVLDTVMAFTVAVPTAIVELIRGSKAERSYPRGLVKPGFSSTHFYDHED